MTRAPEPAAAEPPRSETLEAAAPSVERERSALTSLLAEHWEYHLRRNPEFASIIGDHRYDDQWSDSSPQAIAEDLEARRVFLARFKALSTDGLSEHERLNQQLIVRDLEETLENARFEEWLMPVNQMSGTHLRLPQISALLRFSRVEDYTHYISRLTTLPRVLEQARVLMREGLSKGLMPPRVQLELCIEQAAKLGQGSPEASPFAKPLEKFPEGIPTERQAELRAATLLAIRQHVLPAYQWFTEFLRSEYVPRGRTEPGAWSLPDGEARYTAHVKSHTTTKLSAAEIHEIGLNEVRRIEGEQEAIGVKLGFKDLAAFRKHIRANKKLYVGSRKEILERYERHTADMYGALPQLFGRLPQQKLRILPTEAYREKDAASAEYFEGATDGSRPGTVWVNTREPEKRLWIDMESTAYHEGVPGHHLQLTIQLELADLPPFRRFGGYGAYMEGWALYSERLGKDTGFFRDPYSDYGRLQDELLRAIRLVVDTGLHAKRWSREDVVKFFHDHSTIDEPTVQSETNRYIVWPGQALAYKVGQLTILRLRDQARAKLAERFDIKAFHDEVLGAGALPLDVLETRILAWIEAINARPS